MASYLNIAVALGQLDKRLLAQLPQALALYYLALPLAVEEGKVSVAMAYPENETAVTALSHLLGKPIVPVRTAVQPLYQAILSQYVPPALPPLPLLVAGQPTASLAALSQRLSQTLAAPLRHLPEANSPTAVLAALHTTPCQLAILPAPRPADRAALLEGSAVPLWLVRENEAQAGQHLLAAMRGFASDYQILHWVSLLAAGWYTHVTFMPLSSAPAPDLEHFLHPDHHPTDEHIRQGVADLRGRGISAWLKYGAGHSVAELVATLRQQPCAVLVLAAEGFGEFVLSVLDALDRETGPTAAAVLILKPPISWVD